MKTERIRTLVVDDSATMRGILVQLLGEQPDIEVAGTAATGHEAVRRAIELKPDVILMDIHMPDLDGIQATWLVSSKVPNGAVIMVTSEERIDFLQKAMAAGAQGYVLKPFGDGSQLLQTVRDAHVRMQGRRIQAVPEEAPQAVRPIVLRHGRRIAVFGTKGGVGRTVVGTSLALSLRAQSRGSVVLLDADFLFGDASVHLGLTPERSILDLIPHMDGLDSGLVDAVVAKHASGVHLLSRPPRPEQAEAISAEHVRAVLGSLAQLYDWTIVDTQLSYDDRMLAVLDLADTYVIVLTAHLGALRNARHFLEVSKTLGYSQDRMCFVLNRANSTAGLTLDDIASVLGTRRIFRLPSAGAQPTQSINDGRPMVSDLPRSQFAQSLASLTDHVRLLTMSEDHGARPGATPMTPLRVAV